MENCIFCKIINGEIPSKKEYEDEDIIVFHDISPKAPVHLLFVPKKHISSLIETTKQDVRLLGGIMVKIKSEAQKLGLDKSGYKVVINNGEAAGQLVFHLHMHLLGGWHEKERGWKV